MLLKLFPSLLIFLFLFSISSFSNVSNLKIYVNRVESDTMTQGDTMSWTWNSNETEVNLLIVFDMNENGQIDSGDIMLAEFGMEDNIQGGGPGDADPADGKYAFPVMRLGFPPVNVILKIEDAGNSVIGLVTTLAISTPVATISGTVTVPAGYSAANLYVEATDATEGFWGAITDSSGAYTINLPDDYADLNDFDVKVSSETGLGGLLAPDGQTLTAVAGDNPGMDIILTKPSSFIFGHVLKNNGDPVEGILVEAKLDEGDNPIPASAVTDSNGYYEIGVKPGDYQIGIDGDVGTGGNYMYSSPKVSVAANGDSIEQDLALFELDAVITGKIIIDGGGPGGGPNADLPGSYLINYEADSLGGGDHRVVDPSGDFELGVSSMDVYEVCLLIGYDIGDPLPDGYTVKDAALGMNGDKTYYCFFNIAPGDTITIELVPIPSGSISGYVSAPHFPDTLNPNPNTDVKVYLYYGDGSMQPSGAPHFIADVDSTNRYIATGLPDTTYIVLACLDTNMSDNQDEYDFSCDDMGMHVANAGDTMAAAVAVVGGAQVNDIHISIGNEPLAIELGASSGENSVSAYPNPFNPNVNIQVSLSAKNNSAQISNSLRMKIYSTDGRLVREFVELKTQSGVYNLSWDGKNQRGISSASGTYILNIQGADGMQTKKLILQR